MEIHACWWKQTEYISCEVHLATRYEGTNGEYRQSRAQSNTSTEWGLVANATPRSLNPPGTTLVPLVKEMG